MNADAQTHLVLIPSYNTGAKLFQTVRDACRYWQPVWVVVDGSTDGPGPELERMTAGNPNLRVFILPANQGKGAAILHGLNEAARHGFTHVLTMDADGQHPAKAIPEFMALSQANPRAMILGVPIFDAGAPRIRVWGRKISNWWTNLETHWSGIGDSLFGFRVYPIADLRAVMAETRWMRRFDFDAEAVIRLCWRGIKPINKPAAVQYFRKGEGGISHYQYGRDNLLLGWMYARLLKDFLLRLNHRPVDPNDLAGNITGAV